MCGIAGWLTASRSFVTGDLDRLLLAISHRGPDDAGTYIDEEAGVALGHKRLSIIDLSPGGHQPMVNPNNGDVLAFNGEIYNFRELRTELEGYGMQFRSQSDSEVLLMAFQQWGVGLYPAYPRYVRLRCLASERECALPLPRSDGHEAALLLVSALGWIGVRLRDQSIPAAT